MPIFTPRNQSAWFFVLFGVLVLALLGGLAACANQAAPLPIPTATAVVVKDTPTPTATVIPTSTPTLEPTNTAVPPSPTPTLGIGSESVSSKDGMVLAYVPEGDFQMGCAYCTQWDNDEKPVHTVWLDAYWIDKTDVTNAMYANCVNAGACKPPHAINSFTFPDYFYNNSFADYPVIYIDWNQAIAYCKWVDRRLPTEAEWEKAARGWDGRTYPWGNQEIDSSRANYGGKVGDTTKVGSYPDGASPYGVLDMAGNVRQWVADWYDPNYYQSQAALRNPQGPTVGSGKVMRGSYWNDFSGAGSRTSSRDRFFPNDSYYNYGFRCASTTMQNPVISSPTTLTPTSTTGKSEIKEPDALIQLGPCNKGKPTPVCVLVIKGSYELVSGATLESGSNIDIVESEMTFPPGLGIDIGDSPITLKGTTYPAGSKLIVNNQGDLEER